jgi:hypothetical protein
MKLLIALLRFIALVTGIIFLLPFIAGLGLVRWGSADAAKRIGFYTGGTQPAVDVDRPN